MKIAVVWKRPPGQVAVEVENGRLARQEMAGASCRLEVEIAEANLQRGAGPTMVLVRWGGDGGDKGEAGEGAFSFFLRDVQAGHPIWIAEYQVAVVPGADRREYDEIVRGIRDLGLVAEPHRYESEPETTYEAACLRTRNLMSPIWLGLSRDMRTFTFGFRGELGHWGYIHPRYHGDEQTYPETDDKPIDIWFITGPGISCRAKVKRWLEERVLPILHGEQYEDDITYGLTAFATLETQPISLGKLRGSEARGVYPHSSGQMLTKEEVAARKDVIDAETKGREEETVCCIRIEAVNTGAVPRYAWFRGTWSRSAVKPAYDGKTGFAMLSEETQRMFAINLIDGQPMPQDEMAILLQPGAKVVYDILVPHQALSRQRAAKLAKLDIPRHLAACRDFWKAKLASAAQIHVPEPAIDERIRAGLLHLDMITFGKEPAGLAMANVGWYAPIGSESSPIIQFYDAMGWHKLAERSIQFFLERQRADGFIQTFGSYEIETGPVLWTMGEHYRTTRDDKWVRRVKPHILKACEYLLAWRERNKKPELKGRGYGMMEGKTSDPEDFNRSFMLNGLSYIGIQRASEMLAKIDPAASKRLGREAAAFRADIRRTFYESMAHSPAVPLGDGSWAPSIGPWPEYRGPLALYSEGGKWSSHGTVGCRDSLNGPLYLVLSEVLDPREIGATFLVKSHHVLFTVENAAHSQPYYSRHDIAHLKRGEIKAFLKTYYTQFASLQDREIYTFWEHYYFSGQHKTHEEAWFLMQTRWMLWMEEGERLDFLRAIPRPWLADGKEIKLEGIRTYFGEASLIVSSHVEGEKSIEARVHCTGARRPKSVTIRVPHPEGLRATRVVGGAYDRETETVTIAPFKGRAEVVLHF